MKLVLFDIDGTLMEWTRVHHDSFSEAFKKTYGIDTDISIITGAGMTEQQIITEVLRKNGLDDETIKSKMKEAMKVMEEYFEKEMKNNKVKLLPGAEELLEDLDKNKVLMGVVTGNLERIARGKLKNAGLNKYIKLGGFGSDHIIRTELVKIAVKNAEEKFGFKLNNNVFSIGDAPSDMKAGKEGGAFKCIGITTGIFSKEQLEEAGADFVFKNLLEKDQILKIILQ
jgi:phosphoglycolate phosphatase-like HAD superfamily hydrolase